MWSESRMGSWTLVCARVGGPPRRPDSKSRALEGEGEALVAGGLACVRYAHQHGAKARSRIGTCKTRIFE